MSTLFLIHRWVIDVGQSVSASSQELVIAPKCVVRSKHVSCHFHLKQGWKDRIRWTDGESVSVKEEMKHRSGYEMGVWCLFRGAVLAAAPVNHDYNGDGRREQWRRKSRSDNYYERDKIMGTSLTLPIISRINCWLTFDNQQSQLIFVKSQINYFDIGVCMWEREISFMCVCVFQHRCDCERVCVVRTPACKHVYYLYVWGKYAKDYYVPFSTLPWHYGSLLNKLTAELEVSQMVNFRSEGLNVSTHSGWLR